MVHDADLTESQQEVLEKLWESQEEGVDLDPDSISEEDRRDLEGVGWIEPGSLTLTASGRDAAAIAVRRHRLAERLIADILRTKDSQMEAEACLLEHSLLQGLDERVCTLLGHPRVCPHGHPIPEGNCCRESRQSVDPVVVSMCGMNPGEEGTVAYISALISEDLQKFLSMGIHPGDKVELVRKTPTIVFRSGHSTFAIDRSLACQVFIRRS